MLGGVDIARQCLAGAAGLQAGLNGGLQSWGHPGMLVTTGAPGNIPAWRVVEINGANGWEKWWEVGFQTPDLLAGDASRGWVDSSGRVRIWAEHSEDLISWRTQGFFSPAAPTPVSGGWEYWMRSYLPMDSAISTGQMWCQSTAVDGDSRNNPFTSLKLYSTVQALAHFSYTMPGDAATLQADLRAYGWTGATVVATSDVDWRIDIPNVSFSAYTTVNRIYWPSYLVANMFGDIVNPIDGNFFSGKFVNSAGVRTKVVNQFCRIGILPL